MRIRSGQGEPDYPARAARALEAIEDFERTSHGQGFLLCALTGNDKTAMGVAAHLYSDDELAEIERIFHAIPCLLYTSSSLLCSSQMNPGGMIRRGSSRLR